MQVHAGLSCVHVGIGEYGSDVLVQSEDAGSFSGRCGFVKVTVAIRAEDAEDRSANQRIIIYDQNVFSFFFGHGTLRSQYYAEISPF